MKRTTPREHPFFRSQEYQVCADHAVPGPSALLYVGAIGLEGREPTIGEQLASHRARWAPYEQSASLLVRVGRLSRVDLEAGTEHPADVATLRRVMSLTIWWHRPLHNPVAKTYQEASRGGALLVQSVGARGRLATEYSNVWAPFALENAAAE